MSLELLVATQVRDVARDEQLERSYVTAQINFLESVMRSLVCEQKLSSLCGRQRCDF